MFAERGDSSLLAVCAGWDDCRRPMGTGQLAVACPVISVHTAKRWSTVTLMGCAGSLGRSVG